MWISISLTKKKKVQKPANEEGKKKKKKQNRWTQIKIIIIIIIKPKWEAIEKDKNGRSKRQKLRVIKIKQHFLQKLRVIKIRYQNLLCDEIV